MKIHFIKSGNKETNTRQRLFSYENISHSINGKAFIQITSMFRVSALFYQLQEQKFWPEREEVEIRIIFKFFCFNENDQMNKQ